jgi:ATP synthase protein I
MTDPRPPQPPPPQPGNGNQPSEPPFVRAVGETVERKLRRRRSPGLPVLSGLGLMGLVGWSVVMPTLVGAALGIWIDRHTVGTRSWTLALLVAGLCLGCLNAWRWVARESRAITAADDTPPGSDDA